MGRTCCTCWSAGFRDVTCSGLPGLEPVQDRPQGLRWVHVFPSTLHQGGQVVRAKLARIECTDGGPSSLNRPNRSAMQCRCPGERRWPSDPGAAHPQPRTRPRWQAAVRPAWSGPRVPPRRSAAPPSLPPLPPQPMPPRLVPHCACAESAARYSS